MLAFSGQEKCSLDANGRFKLSPHFISDFNERGEGNVVLHCLPEGAIAIYPEDIYLEMRKSESRPAEKAAASMMFRRKLRYFGAMSQSQKISQQGRITIPEMFRDFAGLTPSSELVMVGAEIGIEIWNAEKWREEICKIHKHSQELGDAEMADELATNVQGDK